MVSTQISVIDFVNLRNSEQQRKKERVKTLNLNLKISLNENYFCKTIQLIYVNEIIIINLNNSACFDCNNVTRTK